MNFLQRYLIKRLGNPEVMVSQYGSLHRFYGGVTAHSSGTDRGIPQPHTTGLDMSLPACVSLLSNGVLVGNTHTKSSELFPNQTTTESHAQTHTDLFCRKIPLRLSGSMLVLLYTENYKNNLHVYHLKYNNK